MLKIDTVLQCRADNRPHRLQPVYRPTYVVCDNLEHENHTKTISVQACVALILSVINVMDKLTTSCAINFSNQSINQSIKQNTFKTTEFAADD